MIEAQVQFQAISLGLQINASFCYQFPEHLPLNTATVKSITGGDEITARHLYKAWFEFKPQFQIVCAVNELPKLDWVDDAYFRRVRILPFQKYFNKRKWTKT